tara:strand:+ start:8190 stop:8714 length:525 start_codon:yes stop_codon:yes gene_type:complete
MGLLNADWIAEHFIPGLQKEDEEATLSHSYTWAELEDGRWSYSNGKYSGVGYFIQVSYYGAHQSSNPGDQSLYLGDVVGISSGKAWKVRSTERKVPLFDTWGIAMGWYDNSDTIIVQITGIVRTIGEGWGAGGRVYVPLHGYGLPQQAPRSQFTFPIGVALNETDLLLQPRLDT